MTAHAGVLDQTPARPVPRQLRQQVSRTEGSHARAHGLSALGPLLAGPGTSLPGVRSPSDTPRRQARGSSLQICKPQPLLSHDPSIRGGGGVPVEAVTSHVKLQDIPWLLYEYGTVRFTQTVDLLGEPAWGRKCGRQRVTGPAVGRVGTDPSLWDRPQRARAFLVHTAHGSAHCPHFIHSLEVPDNSS